MNGSEKQGFVAILKDLCGHEAAAHAASDLERMELKFEDKIDDLLEVIGLSGTMVDIIKMIEKTYEIDLGTSEIVKDVEAATAKARDAVRTANMGAFVLGYVSSIRYHEGLVR